MTDDAQAGTQAELAFRVTGGGDVSAEELAAVTVALTPMGGAAGDAAPAMSGWARAALIEGIGGRPPVSFPDLVQGRFGLGHVGDPHAS